MEIFCAIIILIGLLVLLVTIPCLIYSAFHLDNSTLVAVIKTILLTLFIYGFFFSLIYLKFKNGSN